MRETSPNLNTINCSPKFPTLPNVAISTKAATISLERPKIFPTKKPNMATEICVTKMKLTICEANSASILASLNILKTKAGTKI